MTMGDSARPVFGTSVGMTELLRDCTRYAPTQHPLLILGEPGTGKSLLARHLHGLSARRGAFVKESAAALPHEMEVALLGGHARGAFTGAVTDRMGLIESAHHGTFFLDELGVASHRLQQLLLQLLDDGTLRRVGELRTRPVDVRFVAATNADLQEMIEQRSFRQDLRDRFGHLVLRLPPLRERRDEILPLADSFLQRERALTGAASRPALSQEAHDALLAAPWRGNIRELESVCRFAVLHAARGETIGLEHLPADFLATMGDVLRHRHERSVSLAARARRALEEAHGNKAAAARTLGISRQHLYRLLGAAGSAVVALSCSPSVRMLHPALHHLLSHVTPPVAAAAGKLLIGLGLASIG